MDTSIKIEKEKFFSCQFQSKQIVHYFNDKGVFTIQDFINLDLDKCISDSSRRKKYRAWQNIMKYKYLGLPLVNDILLDKEYKVIPPSSIRGKSIINRDMEDLGFGGHGFTYESYKYFSDRKTFSIIDLINIMDEYSTRDDYLREFYVEYYKEKKAKEHVIKGNKELANELSYLITQRDELNKKIDELIEKINSKEVKHHGR